MLDLQHVEHELLERGWWANDPAINRPAFGVVLHQWDGIWVVARVLLASPAEKAGVQAGESLVSVDGFDVGASQGEMHELNTLMALDTATVHRVNFSGEGGSAIERLCQSARKRGPGSACNRGPGFDARLRRGGMAEGVARRHPATA